MSKSGIVASEATSMTASNAIDTTLTVTLLTFEPTNAGSFATTRIGRNVNGTAADDKINVVSSGASVNVNGLPAQVTIVSQFVQNDTMKIELLHFLEPGVSGTPSAVRNQVGFTHLSFYVDDVDTAAARLVECGGTVLENTRSNPGVDLVFLADPDGTRVELMKAGE